MAACITLSATATCRQVSRDAGEDVLRLPSRTMRCCQAWPSRRADSIPPLYSREASQP